MLNWTDCGENEYYPEDGRITVEVTFLDTQIDGSKALYLSKEDLLDMLEMLENDD